MSSAVGQDWDRRVAHIDEIASSRGFQTLRNRILELAAPQAPDLVLDVGAGTGLLSLALAARVSHVAALDISPAMLQELQRRASQERLSNVEPVVACATQLPFDDSSLDIVVSNYCFHHLDDAGKLGALSEIYRVLRPGGRLVFADMMFGIGLSRPRDRAILAAKIIAMLKKGIPGLLRIAKNALRFGAGRWEQPARTDWWAQALRSTGFTAIRVEPLEHEGGIASAYRP
jgi:ubiquinone/menaquinone biosynthesis C-methylase UbiE